MTPKIRPKERSAILNSLRAGVVPHVGQHHIQVDRAQEIKALLGDIDQVAEGGASVRLVIGPYGSGKTFFLQLVQAIALERKLIATRADLNPDRRLHATGGQARSLYAELMRNLATRARPDGGALASVAERFISDSLNDARARDVPPAQVIQDRLHHLTHLVNGFDFAEVVGAYWQGHESGNDQLKSDAVRWLRGEFGTKTEARTALGVRTIIDDSNSYDMLKLLARFSTLAGFSGLLVSLDELVNLYKLSNSRARNSNYEQILRILNDCLQGSAEHLGILMGGTPEFLQDPRRGLYSYEALQSRLAENTFAGKGIVDYSGPVIRLGNLSAEDLFILLGKIHHVMVSPDPERVLLPEQGIHAFMEHCSKRVGEAYFRTPRTSIKAFVDLLSVLDQNPELDWKELIGTVEISEDPDPGLEPLPTDDEGGSAPDDGLSSFTL